MKSKNQTTIKSHQNNQVKTKAIQPLHVHKLQSRIQTNQNIPTNTTRIATTNQRQNKSPVNKHEVNHKNRNKQTSSQELNPIIPQSTKANYKTNLGT